MRLIYILLVALAVFGLTAVGCAHSQLTTGELFEPGEGRVVLSLPKLSCLTCGTKVAKTLEALPGVNQVAFSKDKVEVGVAFNPTEVTPTAILEASNSVGETVVMGAGSGSYAPAVEHAEESDTIIISRGEEVTLSEHLAAGKVTVVDFYADWCGPCRRVAIVMNAIMSDRADVALRKVDIVDWDTPVAQQHMREVTQLPFTIVFDGQGNEVRRIVGLDIPGLHAAIEEASK
ncbi:MAG: thioredoxin domain-containing protein [Myxococcota bacterium]